MPRFISALFLASRFINPPTFFGWVIFVALLAAIVWLAIHSKEYQPRWGKRSWLRFGGLLLLTIFGNLFVGIYIKPPSLMSLPGIPLESYGIALMVFGALGWVIAAGTLGPIPALILGMIAGLLRAPFDTHTLFTTLEFGLLAILFSIFVRQRYRTSAFKILRQPIFASIALIPLFSILVLIGIFFSASHFDITARLDFAINNTGAVSLAFLGELLFAGIISQILVFIFPANWARTQALKPSPAEERIETRFLIGMGTFIVILLLSLLIGDWIIAGQAARRMLDDRLENTAQIAAESVPFFLETGQNLGVQLAEDQALLSANREELATLLDSKIRLVPYFNQLFVVDASANILGEYPPTTEFSRQLTQEELSGISFAFSGVPTQTYTITPLNAGDSARISFIIAIPNNDEPTISRVLIGRTDLNTNPITRPILNSLDSMTAIEGQGFLIDENGYILYHSDNNLIMNQYEGEHRSEAAFYDATSTTGTRELVFYQPVIGRAWAVVLKVPASQVQQLSLRIAAPLSVLILVLTLLALVALRFSLRIISRSLQNLASEAGHIAEGKLDHVLETPGMDEVGQLRRAFEQMRISLKDRLEELNRLLVVSRSIASSLEMKDIFQPVLEAIKSTGADTVQVILSPEIMPDLMSDMPTRFAIESTKGKYAHLDVEIFEAIQKQDQLLLPNLARTSGGLQLSEFRPNPAALFALSLRNDKEFFGVLWAAYDKPKLFTEADIRFITTLGGQTALAAANAHLFLSVEVGRQQLASILDSTSDPVLVTDHKDRLILANPAAWKVLGLEEASLLAPIDEILSQPELIELLKVSAPAKDPAEIELEHGKTFLATASSVFAEERPIGRVCILRDVTHFKELDTLKSEFVSTVSHDLRSPLTLIRGYATMMEIAGDINEQQQGYIGKIITGVENMSRLVNNLLDLGRIELGVGLDLAKIPVLDILDRVISALQLHASEKNIDFSLETAPDLPPIIEADQDLLHQAVYNLVENAIKYTPEGKRVSVRAHASAEDIFFEISDSGIGISEKDQEHLFEKFFRSANREARAQTGTGLGLAIVRSIAEQHGGRIWVESQIEKGSTFHLQVPITQPERKE